MRRADREVTDPRRIGEIFRACECCRLGLCDGGRAYVVPMSFGFDRREDGVWRLFFHSAPEGRKIRLLRQAGWASFEMDTGYRLRRADAACGYSAAYQCVMGGGPVAFLEDPEEKRAALAAIMRRTAGDGDWTFPGAARVCVFSLEAEELSCKVHE